MLLTHTDLDGIGCGIVFRSFLPSTPAKQIVLCNYGLVDAAVRKILETTDEKLLITDLALERGTAEYIERSHPGRVELLDHHKTSVEPLAGYPWARIDTDHAATWLLFEELGRRYPEAKVPGALGTFVRLVEDYDLWRHEFPDSARLNAMLYMLGQELFTAAILPRIAEDKELVTESDRLYVQGLEHHKCKYFMERLKGAQVVGNRLLVVASRYLSELSQYIRNNPSPPDEWKDVDYIDMLNFEYGTHALRSYNPDFDVSQVAQEKGGGGHPKASGHPMSFGKLPQSWLSEI